MSQLLEQYNNNLNLKYYKSLKKTLHKRHITKYDSYLENILSDVLSSESESVTQSVTQGVTQSVTQGVTQSVTQDVTQSVTQSVTISDIKIKDDNIDDFYYKKPWNKLNIVHKKIKIKEYINNLMLTKEKKTLLINKLIILLNNKKLNKKNEVDYDNINGKIITIMILKCKNDEYFI